MKNEKEIGEIIQKLRGDMSLRDFAQKCDVSHTTIDNLEKGVDFRTGKPTQVKASTLQKIATACGISMSVFMTDIDEKKGMPATINGNGRVVEFIEMFQLLTSEQQKLIISQIKGILSNQ